MPETAPELRPALVVTTDDGTEYHATDEYGDRLPAWKAERLHWGHVQYRRRFRVTFPRYSRGDVVREAIAAALLPWERVVTARTHGWGDDDADVSAGLVFPSSSWCMECGHDVRPDEYRRVSPYAVSITPAATHRSYTVRNYSHAAAHQLAERERAAGNAATVGIDACG